LLIDDWREVGQQNRWSGSEIEDGAVAIRERAVAKWEKEQHLLSLLSLPLFLLSLPRSLSSSFEK